MSFRLFQEENVGEEPAGGPCAEPLLCTWLLGQSMQEVVVVVSAQFAANFWSIPPLLTPALHAVPKLYEDILILLGNSAPFGLS